MSISLRLFAFDFFAGLPDNPDVEISDRKFSIDPDRDEVIAWRFPVPGRRRDGVWSFGKPGDAPTADELKDNFEPVLDEKLSNALDIEARAAFESTPSRESAASQA